MGIMIDAHCECGFESRMMGAGYGFHSFREGKKEPQEDYWPSYCPKCRTLGMTDTVPKTRVCEHCGGEVLMYGWKKVSKNKLTFRDDSKSTGHLCPQCQKFTLVFEEVGMWD